MLSSRTFRLYASSDRIGVQLGGAMKNVLAIACGIVEGAGLGDSARAALISRGLAEMSRLVEAMGGRAFAVVVGLSAPGELPLAWALDLADGIRAEGDLSGVVLVGGDVTRSRDVTISVTVFGALDGRRPVRRSGAGPDQVVALVGRTGWAAAGNDRRSRRDVGGRSPTSRANAPYASSLAEPAARCSWRTTTGLFAWYSPSRRYLCIPGWPRVLAFAPNASRCLSRT